MSRRHAFRADWLKGNVKILRAQYERTCRVPVCGQHEWLKIEDGNRSVRVLVHGDLKNANAVILYFHGGGWIVGSPSTHADITSDLHRYTRLPVVSVDYRLAPESKAVLAIDDGLVVLSHLLANDTKRVVLCGDSAGASIALAVELHAPTQLRAHIIGVCSFYGVFRSAGCNSIRKGSRVSGLDQACLRRFWLLANESRGQSRFSIPVLARADGSPVYIVAGGNDPLRDDSIMLARRLKSMGRTVMFDVSRFAQHGFLHRLHRDKTREGTFQRVSSWITRLRTTRE